MGEEERKTQTEFTADDKDNVIAPASFSISFRSLNVSTSSVSPRFPLLPDCLGRAWKRILRPPTMMTAAAAVDANQIHSSTSHTRSILHDLSGYIPSNALTAIMGGSGAGKTTLLNFLAHRLPGCDRRRGSADATSMDSSESNNSGFHVSGDIRVNGVAVDSDFFAKHTAYVPQQSVLLSSLTPRESILFASKLRVARHPDDSLLQSIRNSSVHEQNTDRILTALSLHQCADTRIGDELIGGGLSGGEKRRTNVAVELVTNPPFLCLDEPSQMIVQ